MNRHNCVFTKSGFQS